MKLEQKIDQAVKEQLFTLFPQHPFIYFGIRTSTLLLQALETQEISTVLMPGFICPHISAMATESGKKVIHIDVNQSTMHMQKRLLDKYLDSHCASDCCLLIDHSFGYVNAEVASIKQRYPDLLIIEDCVRTLGGTSGAKPVGFAGDWIILSMYKTVHGNEHGGILLSRTPLSCEENGRRADTSLREYLSKINVLRRINDKIKAKRASLGSESPLREHIRFNVQPGLPSPLITYRFLYELKNLTTASNHRSTAWHHLYHGMCKQKKLQFIQIQPQTKPSYHFLSFTIPDIKNLYFFLQCLNRVGYFLFNAWPDTPNYFRCFQKTFPYGYENTLYLAKNIVHIPIADFISVKKRNKFLLYFNDILKELQ